MVLLKNDPVGGRAVLPLDRTALRSIALIGRLAAVANMGDHGSSDVRPPVCVTPFDGVRAAFPEADVALVEEDDAAAASAAAAAADVAIVVVGYDARDEGEYTGPDTVSTPELLRLFPPVPADMRDRLAKAFRAGEHDGDGGDRTSLTLRSVDEDIIGAVGAANPSTIVAIVAAGAVLTERWRSAVPAVLMMWYPGMEGGHALADVLTGAHNPSGRLPFAIPTSEEHLPSFERSATAITYDRYHGQRLLDRLGVPAAFPHGFGLSYTTFDLRRAVVDVLHDDSATLTVEVANTGTRDGGHVVQVYGRALGGPYAGEHMLVGFAPVFVPAASTVSVTVPVSLWPLAAWDASSRRRVLPTASDVELEVGSHAHDSDAVPLRLGKTTAE
jgi:beta-glucosidase